MKSNIFMWSLRAICDSGRQHDTCHAVLRRDLTDKLVEISMAVSITERQQFRAKTPLAGKYLVGETRDRRTHVIKCTWIKSNFQEHSLLTNSNEVNALEGYTACLTFKQHCNLFWRKGQELTFFPEDCFVRLSDDNWLVSNCCVALQRPLQVIVWKMNRCHCRTKIAPSVAKWNLRQRFENWFTEGGI